MQTLDDLALQSLAPFDDDAASKAVGKLGVWAACNGLSQWGAVVATPEHELPPSTLPIIPETPTASPAQTTPPEPGVKPALPSGTGGAAAGALNPEIQGQTPPVVDQVGAGDKTEQPVEGKQEEPPVPKPPRVAKSMVIEIARPPTTGSSSSLILNALGLTSDPMAPPVMVGERAARSVSGADWPRPLLYVENGTSLVVATDARGLQYALDRSSEAGDAIEMDWAGQRKKVADDRAGLQGTLRSVAAIMVNVNALRHEYESSFLNSNGAGLRTLSLWKMSNVRSMSVHVGVLERADATPLVLADACWSARSDAPGTCMRGEITSGLAPSRAQATMIPDCQALVVFKSNIRPAMDWISRAYLANVSDDFSVIGDSAFKWRVWLHDERITLTRLIDSLGSWGTIGLKGLSGDAATAVFPFRVSARAGTKPEKLSGLLTKLLRKVGVEQRDGDQPAWLSVIDTAWLKGTIAWTITPVQGLPVVIGNFGLFSADAMVATRTDAAKADFRAPLPPDPVPTPKRPRPAP